MKKLGFSRHERLKKSREFVQVIRGGKKIRGHFLALSYREASQPFPRLGLVIPKRILRRAHERNQMKRWLRELFRHAKHEIKPGHDLVFHMHRIPVQLDFEEVKQEFFKLLKRAELFL